MGVHKEEMMEKHLHERGITDPAVLNAMWEVDRSMFVPHELIEKTYEDSPLPIGMKQTISQPFIVAYMAQALCLRPEEIVLEIGTGCGYNAAVLSRIVSHVFSIEVIEWLAQLAVVNLTKTGYRNITTRLGDGYVGWPEVAPFDAIILTAAPPAIPKPLMYQLKIGGRLLAPVGTNLQKLNLVIREKEDLFHKRELIPVKFVPMTGKAQRRY